MHAWCLVRTENFWKDRVLSSDNQHRKWEGVRARSSVFSHRLNFTNLLRSSCISRPIQQTYPNFHHPQLKRNSLEKRLILHIGHSKYRKLWASHHAREGSSTPKLMKAEERNKGASVTGFHSQLRNNVSIKKNHCKHDASGSNRPGQRWKLLRPSPVLLTGCSWSGKPFHDYLLLNQLIKLYVLAVRTFKCIGFIIWK